MAILAELFLVLAGFESGTSAVEGLHPAEAAAFERAAQFGKRVSTLNVLTRGRLDHPVCRVVKDKVAFAYLQALADLEAAVLAQAAAQAAALPDSLAYAARVLAGSVDAWAHAVEFALAMLSQLKLPLAEQARWIADFAARNASVPRVAAVGDAVLAEIDAFWHRELLRVLVEGQPCTPFLLDHARAPEAELVRDVTLSMQQLMAHAETDARLLEPVLDLAEACQARLETQLAAPLDALRCAAVLREVRKDIVDVVRARVLRTSELRATLRVLRRVILLGSPRFLALLADSGGDLAAALDLYFESPGVGGDGDDGDGNDAPPSTGDRVGPRILAQTDEPQQPLRIVLSPPLAFVFSKEQCTIYESLFLWLYKLALAAESIGFGRGRTPHAYRLLFDALWSHCQDCIDEAFAKLHRVLETDGRLNIRSQQDGILRALVSQLMLDRKEFRAALGLALSHCLTNDPEPLALLCIELQKHAGLHALHLAPFLRFTLE